MTRKRALELRIEALVKERLRLLAKGVPPNAPRVMKLANLITRLRRSVAQHELRFA